MHRSTNRAALLALPLIPLAGCVQDNARITTGAANTTLPIFANAPVGDVTTRAPDAPSTTTLNRSSWASTDFLVQPDALRTRPTYANNSTTPADSARQRGDPPTPRSALDFNTTTRSDLYQEAFLSPVYALGDLALMPWRIYKHSRSQRINPAMSYWRTPTADASLANPASTRLLVETHSSAPTPTPPAPAHEPDADAPPPPPPR